MKLSTRSIRYRWHQLIRTKKIQISGVFISTAPSDIARRIRKALFNGTYEDQERFFVEKYVKKTSRILEIGCGIGLVSLVARKICKEGFVISYEANPQMEKLIRKNYELNNLVPNLEMKAVSVHGEKIEFYIDPEVLSSSLFDRKMSHKKVIVESDAFDDILNKIKPDTIIMDVEGAEIDLLGSSRLIGVALLIIEIHPHIVGDDKISQLNQKLGTLYFKEIERRGKVCVYARN